MHNVNKKLWCNGEGKRTDTAITGMCHHKATQAQNSNLTLCALPVTVNLLKRPEFSIKVFSFCMPIHICCLQMETCQIYHDSWCSLYIQYQVKKILFMPSSIYRKKSDLTLQRYFFPVWLCTDIFQFFFKWFQSL